MSLYLLYGPPGSGKSTAVRFAGSLELKSIDLEEYSPDAVFKPASEGGVLTGFIDREVDGSPNTPAFVGMAGVRVEHARQYTNQAFPDAFHVLILPLKAEYLRRRNERDRKDPRKAGQADYYDGFLRGSGKFDLIVDDPLAFIRAVNGTKNLSPAHHEGSLKCRDCDRLATQFLSASEGWCLKHWDLLTEGH